jgi:drug/metabolite transporter (DMT)-like permease
MADAWAMNPGAVLMVPALGAVALYAAITLALRLEPWRPSWRHRVPWRWLLVLAVLGNWIYLLAAGRA